jgi:hypothetical protein
MPQDREYCLSYPGDDFLTLYVVAASRMPVFAVASWSIAAAVSRITMVIGRLRFLGVGIAIRNRRHPKILEGTSHYSRVLVVFLHIESGV